MNINTNLIDFLKLPTKIFVSLTIASGLVLFLPDTIIEKIYMTNFTKEYGFIIGLVFIISISISLVSCTIILYKYIIIRYNKFKFYKHAAERLEKLSPYQKAILYSLYLEDNYTHELPFNDGAVKILEQKMMITKTTNTYLVEDLSNPIFPYMLQPWVIEKLNEDNDLVEKFRIESIKSM